MKLFSHQDAKDFLMRLSLKIDEWNRLKFLPKNQDLNFHQWLPSADLDLYFISAHLAQWLGAGDWIFIQIDNSTSPIREEKYVFQKIIGCQYELDIYLNKSIFIEYAEAQSLPSKMTDAMMIIYFALKYYWHLDLVSGASKIGQRLRLNDGVIYFYGFEEEINNARSLSASYKTEDFPMADWQLCIENQ